MANKSKVLNTREFITLLKNNNFRHVSTKGSHMKFVRGNCVVNVPMHSKNMNSVLMKTHIKKYNLL